MKYIVLTVLLAVIQAMPPVPRKAPDHPASTSHTPQSQPAKQAKPSNATVPTQDKEEAKTENSAAAKQSKTDAQKSIGITETAPVSMKDWWDKTYVISACILVLVGAAGVGAAISTLKAIKAQAAVMTEQREVMLCQLRTMQEQVTQMVEQTGVLEKSVAVAQASADAAKASIQHMLAKERPRLDVEIDEIEMGIASIAGTATYTIFYSGTTPATIIDSGIQIQTRLASQAISDEPILSLPMFIPKRISADMTGITIPLPVWWANDTSEFVQSIFDSQKVIWVQGFIKYGDVFEWERHMHFCFRWRVFFSALTGKHYGHWERSGPGNWETERKKAN